MRLFLTVGTNPLPVFVAASRLLNNELGPCPVTYVHSQGTKGEAERIQALLKADQHEYLAVDPFNPRACEKDLQSGSPPAFAEAHLHYTGGTKCMGVEVARYLSARGNLGLSYLDGATQTLHLESAQVDDLRRHVHLKLDQLAELHGQSLRNADQLTLSSGDNLWAALMTQAVFPRLSISHSDGFVCLMYGYHLLLVADQRCEPRAGAAKSAGYEAFLRTRKWGGDEARVLLVVSFELERNGKSTEKDVRYDFPQHADMDGKINSTPVFVWSCADEESFSNKWKGLFDALRWFPY
jgi:hypothetical protein